MTVINTDCVAGLAAFPDNTFDSVVTDPPYELGFMGKTWDSTGVAFDPNTWAAVMRVLKPGGHMLAFSGSRTYHRMAVAIEDGGFEIRDQIMWVYGSGFPKSLDVSKAIDKDAGAVRVVIGKAAGAGTKDPTSFGNGHNSEYDVTAPATDAARQWQGWGTALKPAHEPICVARKPLIGTVAANVLVHGTGALNIDGCRVGTDTAGWGGAAAGGNTWNDENCGLAKGGDARPVVGRWPANLIHDGSDEVLACFPDTARSRPVADVPEYKANNKNAVYGRGMGTPAHAGFSDLTDSAARFFYCAKASRSDRGEGNIHPTVKPTDLMRYLCRLVTPPGGLVLDPFTGSGSTGKAAVLEGFQFIGFELSAEYAAIAQARIDAARGRK